MRISNHPKKSVSYGVPRRQFLNYMAMVSVIPLSSGYLRGKINSSPKFSSYPFSLGVASGDPEPDGVVIWTRLAPDPLGGGGIDPEPILVKWEVSQDEAFTKVVQQGSVVAGPQLGHSIHVELHGLKAHNWYYFRFHAGAEVSPVGRTRTAPAMDAMPEKMKFAFTSCQHFEVGYFNGYPHMQDEDLDLVIHLGDYIYEYAGMDKRVRKHIGSKEIESLDEYRQRYAQYRMDEDLQETHRVFPWLVTWDDHEFDNNYANLVSEEEGISPEAFLARRMNAYQAYYEFMPLRKRSFPQGPDMKLFRQCKYGRLADFFVLDTRQYRTDQPNGDRQKPMTGKVFDPQATMLGKNQENWLMSGMLKSDATWNVLAQQVMMAALNRGDEKGERYSMDQWPGYEISRRRLLRFFHERKIANPVVLTGDIHLNWVNDLQLDFKDPKSPIVGTEWVGTSMSSAGNGGNFIPEYERAAKQNDFVKWYNSNRGYVSCELTKDQWKTSFRATPYVSRKGAPIETKAVFMIEEGRPGAQLVSKA